MLIFSQRTPPGETLAAAEDTQDIMIICVDWSNINGVTVEKVRFGQKSHLVVQSNV